MDLAPGQALAAVLTVLLAGALVLLVRERGARRRSERDAEAGRNALDESARSRDAERSALVDAAHEASARADRADRAKDEFVATVSHELRTPLNVVLGWARLLRLGRLEPEAAARAVETIERSANAQAQIVDDLLDVSRIVRGELRLDMRPLELVPVVEAALDAVRPAAEARRITLAAVLVTGAGPVAADPARLQQVVWNLVSNAVKFTPTGGRVEVRLAEESDEVSIRVRDSGAGIDPAFLPHVFERFRQADSSTTRPHGGLGLGLAIVRHLVEAHGGSVSAESPGPGKGATFTVRLPISSARARRDVGGYPTATRGAGPPTPLARLEQVRVLVVDDDPDTLEVVREVLEEAGADVIAAASAREALAAVSARPPDVLLSDLGMPGEDGFTLIRKVRGLEPGRGGGVPAAALTAYTQSEDRNQALHAGFQLYLSKPIEPAELTAAVARLAGRLN